MRLVNRCTSDQGTRRTASDEGRRDHVRRRRAVQVERRRKDNGRGDKPREHRK